MLVLTRKIDEAVEIGPKIRVTVVRMKGRKVALGIDAPAGVAIVRPELKAGSCKLKANGRRPS